MNHSAPYRLGPLAAMTIATEVVVAALLGGAWWYLRQEPGAELERPWALWGLAGGPLMVIVFLLHAGWRLRALRRFADPALLARLAPPFSGELAALRFLLLRHGFTLLVLALAGPRKGDGLVQVEAQGIDMLVAVDVSNSMACADLKPSRLEAMHSTLHRLVDRLRGDRIGIVAFAGEAHVLLPLTADRAAARLFIDGIDTRTVSAQGTAIGTAIDLAARSFDPNSTAGRAIVVISDGEDHEDDAYGAARRAREQGMVVHTIGMGTPQGGPIPIKRGEQVTGYHKDRAGNTVISRMDEAMLTGIAEAGGGVYLRGTGTGDELSALREQLATLEQSAMGTYRFETHHAYFEYPLIAGLLLSFLGLLLGEHRPRWAGGKGRAPWATWLPFAVLLFSGCGDRQERARLFAMHDGQRAYHNAALIDAAMGFRRAEGHPWAAFNLAATYQRMGLLDSAVMYFQRALADPRDSGDVPQVWYGLANASLRQAGIADTTAREALAALHDYRDIQGDVRQRLRATLERDSLLRLHHDMDRLTDTALHRAARAYREVLRAHPADQEARHDLAVTLRRMAARRREAPPRDPDRDKDPRMELTERARLLIAKADTLVDEHRFKDALDLLTDGLRREPSLKQEQQYMDKLQTVTEAAAAP